VLVLTPMSHSANVLYIIMKINPRKHAHIPDLLICVLACVLACVRRACVHVHGCVEGRWWDPREDIRTERQVWHN